MSKLTIVANIKAKGNYLWGQQLNLVNPSIRNCLQGAGGFRKQTGVTYWSYVNQADRGKIQYHVSSYSKRRQN